jgi:hypothetical protein
MVKTIKLNNGNQAEVSSGDIVFVSLLPDSLDYLVRCRYIDSKDGIVTISILNPNLEPEIFPISESRVIKIEKPN